MSMANSTNRVEIITSVQRRPRWTAPEKVRMVKETFEPDMTVSLVACRHGVAPNQLFTWRRLVAQGSRTAPAAGKRSCLLPIIGVPRFANFIGSWARRRWKRRFSKRPLLAPFLVRKIEAGDADYLCHSSPSWRPTAIGGPRRSQAAGAGCRSETAQPQASLPGHESSRPAA